jgi:F-type H+-transporting ATPase subunit b
MKPVIYLIHLIVGLKPGRIKSKHLSVLTLFMGIVFSAGLVWASGGGDGDAKGWVATDTYRVMNFSVLAIALFFLLRKPVSQALSGRIKGIQDQLNDLEARKKQAEAELARYNEKLSALDKEAEKIIAEYISQGKEARARILKEAEAAAHKIENQARRNIEHEFKQARKNLQTGVLEKALARAETLIKENYSEEDQIRMVDEYISKVVTR